MLSRLKFDLSEIINEKLTYIPNYIWESKTTTFCDLQMGGGQYIKEIINKLRVFGHSDENIKSRVFGFSENEFYLAVVQGDSSLIGTFNVYNENINMNFTVKLGNPPYQKITNLINSDNNKQGSFWWEIIENGLNKNESDIIMYTIPTSLFSIGGWGTKRHKITNLYNRGYKITHIWTNCNEHFPGISIPISSFIAQKTNSTSCNLVDKNQIINIDYSKPFPFIMEENTFSILQKCFSDDNWNFREIDNSNNDDIVVKINGGRFKNYSKLFVGISKNSPHKAQTLILDNSVDIDIVNSIFKSKLFQFIFKIYGGENGQSSTGILKKLPKILLNKEHSDTSIYRQFKLSNKEIDYIENYVG